MFSERLLENRFVQREIGHDLLALPIPFSELALREQRALLERFNEIAAAFVEPMDDDVMTRLLDEQASVQERIDTLDLWNLGDAARRVSVGAPALAPPACCRRGSPPSSPAPAARIFPRTLQEPA